MAIQMPALTVTPVFILEKRIICAYLSCFCIHQQYKIFLAARNIFCQCNYGIVMGTYKRGFEQVKKAYPCPCSKPECGMISSRSIYRYFDDFFEIANIFNSND